MLADVREHLRLLWRIVDGECAIGTGEVQPFRHELIEMPEILLERGEARVVPVDIIPNEFRRAAWCGQYRRGARVAYVCEMLGKSLLRPLKALLRAVGNGFGLWGSEVMPVRQGPDRRQPQTWQHGIHQHAGKQHCDNTRAHRDNSLHGAGEMSPAAMLGVIENRRGMVLRHRGLDHRIGHCRPLRMTV